MSKRWIHIAVLVMVALAFLILPHFIKRYTLFVLYLLCINISMAQSWNLLGGYTGLISLGHAAFFGLGAYTTGLTVNYFGLHFLLAAAGGGLVAAAFSVVMAVPTFRFRGIYFAIGTIVIAEALRIWMINWEFAGGAQGLHFPPGSGTSLRVYYYIMLAVAAGTTALIAIILRTKLGLGLRAIRDNEDSAANMGVNIFRTKLYAFCISAFIAGLTGGIHAVKMSTIEPSSIFSAGWSLSTINMVIMGGIGTILGPIFGAVFFTYLAEFLVNYHTYHLLLTGIILVLVIRFVPAGIWGRIIETASAKRLSRRFSPGAALERG